MRKLSVTLLISAFGLGSLLADAPSLTERIQVHFTREDEVAGRNRVQLTGSHIKQPLTQYGIVTDGMHPVRVLGRREMERNGGATTPAEFLRAQGVQINGGGF